MVVDACAAALTADVVAVIVISGVHHAAGLVVAAAGLALSTVTGQTAFVA